ncbi:hypothetical protein BBJ28_00014168 [Nothophytophthora sp. Chile5]|nr:hypothetical protein BBJ28_00014168 [Nothophytophthora sp. Chile5]
MYGSVDFAAMPPPLPDVSKQNIAAEVAALRQGFASGITKQIATRKTLLRSIQRLINENETRILQAAWKDMHRHPVEVFCAEIAMVRAEIQLFLDYPDAWTKPERRSTNSMNLPGQSFIYREPLGVVCVIGTWNYPISLLMQPLVNAIGAGNCALLRLPGDDTTLHMNDLLIKLFDEYLDNRYIRYVYGGLQETETMLRERYDLIFAAGSTFTGKLVAQAAAQYLTPMVLELGGKSPAIVDDSADLAVSARRIAWGAFYNAGQTYVRPDYVLVDAKIGDRFVALMEKEIEAMYGAGSAVGASESYGRLINQRLFKRVMRILEHDRERVTYGGESDETQRFIAPTLLNFRSDFVAFTTSAAMGGEIFGPLLAIYYYGAGRLDAAIGFVATREKPLALYHFSSNARNKHRMVEETSAGSLVVNDVVVQGSNLDVPFGGVGNSGMGAARGFFGFEAFSHRKTVIFKTTGLDMPQRYSLYSSKAERVMRIVMYPFSRRQLTLLKTTVFVAAVGVGVYLLGHSISITQV